MAMLKLRGLLMALSPAPWAIIYQMLIVVGVTWGVLASRHRDALDRPGYIRLIGYIGGGCGLLLALMAMPHSAVSLIAGFVIVWFVSAMLIERQLDLDISTAQTTTGMIWAGVLMGWVIIGAAIVVLRSL